MTDGLNLVQVELFGQRIVPGGYSTAMGVLSSGKGTDMSEPLTTVPVAFGRFRADMSIEI